MDGYPAAAGMDSVPTGQIGKYNIVHESKQGIQIMSITKVYCSSTSLIQDETKGI